MLRAYQPVERRKDILRRYCDSWYRRIDAALLRGTAEYATRCKSTLGGY
jgi:hypothetical protein